MEANRQVDEMEERATIRDLLPTRQTVVTDSESDAASASSYESEYATTDFWLGSELIREDFYHIKLRSTHSHNVTKNKDDNSVQVEDVDTEEDEDTPSGVLLNNSAGDQVRNDVRDQVRDVRQTNEDEAVPILPDHNDANPMDGQPVNSGGNVNINVNIF